MKYKLIAVAILLLVQLVVADLQGPQVTVAEIKENLDVSEKKTKIITDESDSSVETNAVDDPNEVPSNERKAAKYIDDQMTAARIAAGIAATIQPEEPKNKVLQFAIFERLRNEEMIRKKLEQEIEELESKKEPAEIVEESPAEIEGIEVMKYKDLIILKFFFHS